MAVASLVLGIVSIVIGVFFGSFGLVGGVIGIVGIILGVQGKKDPAKKGMATAGFVCSILVPYSVCSCILRVQHASAESRL